MYIYWISPSSRKSSTNSSSLMTRMPNSLALVSLLPLSSPATTSVVFFDTEPVTFEEVGDSVHVDSTPTYMDEERQRYEQYNQYGPQVKVYSFNSTSWLSRIILIIILAVVLAAVVFFGGIILSVVGVVILVGAIVSFIFGLF